MPDQGLDAAIHVHAHDAASRGLAELVDAERRERAVGVGDLHVHVGRIAGRARVPHGADAERVGHLQKLVLERRHDRVGMAVPYGPELRRLLGDAERLVLGPADDRPR